MTATPFPPGEPRDFSTETKSGSPAASPPAIGSYTLLQRVGEGGMGEVWLAQQMSPVRRQVAIKVVKAGMDTAQVLARFDAERQALAVMDHPAIAKIFDGGSTPEGRPYFAMEFVRGEAITEYCDAKRLSIQERLGVFLQLCDGVQHAHQKGIIHRDLKPTNVLVSEVDGKPSPHIIDFGIAKAMARPLTDQPLFTGIGGFVGTLDYMSPEQAEVSSLDVDTRSDVYSLGVMLYELLTGTLPFDGPKLREAGVDEFRKAIREHDPPKPSTRITDHDPRSTTTAERRETQATRLISLLRGDLDWIVMKALDKDRARRYQTVNALAADVRRHLNHEPVAAGPPSAIYRARKFTRRHRAGVAVGSASVLLLIAVAALTAIQAGRIARERDRANQEAATAKRVSDFLVGLFRVADPSQTRGRSVTAREILDRGAAELEKLGDQPDIQARLQATIGSVYTGLGAYDAAGALLDRAVTTRRRVLGTDHPETLAALNDLANLLWFQGRYNDAEPVYLEVVERSARVLGDEHAATLRARFDLASNYSRQLRWAEAEQLQRQILAVQQRALGKDHPDTLASLGNLAAYLNAQQRYADAATILREVIDSRRRVLGADHPSTLVSLANLGFSYHHMGDHARAEGIYLEALALQRRVNGHKHTRTASVASNLADLYVALRRYKEAEPLALSAYEAYRDSLGVANAQTQRAVKLVGDIYQALGDSGRASEWRTKLSDAGVPSK